MTLTFELHVSNIEKHMSSESRCCYHVLPYNLEGNNCFNCRTNDDMTSTIFKTSGEV